MGRRMNGFELLRTMNPDSENFASYPEKKRGKAGEALLKLIFRMDRQKIERVLSEYRAAKSSKLTK